MKYRRQKLIVLTGTVVTLATTWSITLIIANSHPQHTVSAAPQPQVIQKAITEPPKKKISVSIPAIHVDAAVEPIGLAADGSMAMPSSATIVGWYKYGAAPGQKGSAVLDGHVDTSDGSPGVFGNLAKLHVGDKIYFSGEKDTLTFVVSSKRYYQATAQPNEVFNKNDKAYLNLITCAGTWDASRKMFSQRLVVFAATEDGVER